MKINDFVYQFKPNNNYRSDFICRARLFIHGEKKYMLLTDLGEKSTSSSVTNEIEHIHANLLQDGHICEKTQLIEHYQDKLSSYGSFDFVFFENGAPTWKGVTIKNLCVFLGCEEIELLDNSLKNDRIFKKVERLRRKINPHIDAAYADSPEVINRRNEIDENKIKKTDLESLIASGAGESEIHSLLVRDLSIFGEFFAHPADEYIVFSEFKLLDGYIDFVVFSGRSRMDVTFIEIKGADFDIVNSTGYENFSAKTNEAVQQIRTRLGDVYRRYYDLRKYFHGARENAESKGCNKFNCFLGPKGELLVDPDKDVNIRTIIIAGRGDNSIEESRKRHDLEHSSQPPIRLESWDSFLNKIDRN
jgi:hypothetical protein